MCVPRHHSMDRHRLAAPAQGIGKGRRCREAMVLRAASADSHLVLECVASGMVVFRRRSSRSVASGSEDDRADSVDANDGIEELPSRKL